MNPWNMFVANSFDAVATKTIVQQRGALQSFGSNNFHVRELLFQVIACTDCSCRTGCRNISSHLTFGRFYRIENFFYGRSGNVIMPARISKFIELVENHTVLAVAANIPAFIVNLLHVRFATRGCNYFSTNFFEPRKTLFAHLFGKYGNGCNAH